MAEIINELFESSTSVNTKESCISSGLSVFTDSKHIVVSQSLAKLFTFLSSPYKTYKNDKIKNETKKNDIQTDNKN